MNGGCAYEVLQCKGRYRLSNDNGYAATFAGGLTANKWMPGEVELFTEEFFKQPPDLPPGAIVEESDSVRLPTDLPAGTYTLSIGVVGEDDTKPVVRLGIKGRSEDGWYPVSKVTVFR